MVEFHPKCIQFSHCKGPPQCKTKCGKQGWSEDHFQSKLLVWPRVLMYRHSLFWLTYIFYGYVTLSENCSFNHSLLVHLLKRSIQNNKSSLVIVYQHVCFYSHVSITVFLFPQERKRKKTNPKPNHTLFCTQSEVQSTWWHWFLLLGSSVPR